MVRKKQPARQLDMFSENNADLPLFSGTAPRAAVEPFTPEPASIQACLPDMVPDWSELAQAHQKNRFPRDADEGEGEGEAPSPS
jgi:hypothetical protein